MDEFCPEEETPDVKLRELGTTEVSRVIDLRREAAAAASMKMQRPPIFNETQTITADISVL